MKLKYIKKRDGKIVKFKKDKITNAIFEAARAVGGRDKKLAGKLADQVVELLSKEHTGSIPTVEDVQDKVEKVLIENGHARTAKAFVLYREKRKNVRETTQLLRDITVVDDYIKEIDWRVRENSNMTYSLQGLNVHITDRVISNYWLNNIYPQEIRRTHTNGDFHIHDLGTLGPYTYFGKEVIVAKKGEEIFLTSFEELYNQLSLEEELLSEKDGAWAKYPQDLKVLDKEGWTKVTRVVKKKKDRKMHFVKNEGGRSVIVTEDHPIILGDKKTKRADKVEEEKDETFTVDPEVLQKEGLFSKKKLFLAEELVNKGETDFWADGIPLEEWKKYEKELDFEGIVSTSNNTHSLPNQVKLTENLGYLLGFYLAEGSTGTHKIRMKVKDTERNSKVVEKAKKGAWELGCNVYTRRTEEDKLVMDIANSTFVNYFLKRILKIHGLSRERKLPNEILSYDKEFIKGIIGGLLDGDGSIATSKTSLDLRISSRTLLEQLATILNLFGFTARDRNLEGQGTIHKFKGKEIEQNYPLFGLSFRVREDKNIPSFKYNHAQNSSKAWRSEEPGWHKVLNNETTEVREEFIYDITTESHTLVVNGMWNHNCVGWDLKDLLDVGFKGVRGKIESKPAKHFRVALMQIVNFLYTLQGEAAGAQAISNFDTLLAPFIRYDGLSRDQVKQAMQEFLFNMNVPTRVGFQCLSADTKILTPEGWKGHKEVEEGETIYTFNLDEKKMEKKEVTSVFTRKYEGKMYNLKNRTQNQLISPNHRVVRKAFNQDKYLLEPIEEILELESPVPIPVSGENKNEDYDISDEKLKLLAWILSEGSMENTGSYRVSIYQKKGETHDEILELLDHFDFEYDKRDQKGLGESVHIRLKSSSSKTIHKWLEGKEKKLPSYLYNLSRRQARIFIDTYIKGDGWKEEYRDRITTTNKKILEGLEAIAVLAGFNFTTRERNPPSEISKKLQYILTLTNSKTDYIQEIKEVDYNDVIWSVHTENETVIAKRKGQVFFTGNTPFTNITMDLTCPEYMKDENVIIGGEEKPETYKEFSKEIRMMNDVFAEVMLEGDAKGRPFTFPIPTYNITEDFDWDTDKYDKIWQMTAKYGTPYFSNFINSDMEPDDVRSMCCRLRLSKRELKKRGGALFGSNPLTGSIGVVTINLPRLGYLSDDKSEFFERLESLMNKAMESLIIKRQVLERFTEQGLYPYSKFYLRSIKKAYGEYWKNHFSTIGIIGMNDALVNLLGTSTAEKEGVDFAEEVLEFMRERLADYQEETGDIFNLEATPGEGTSYRLAKIDKERYPDIKVFNQEKYDETAEPYYTNSSQLPVGYTDDIFEALKLQDPLQTKYTGGTVLHGFIGESMPSNESVKKLVRNVAENFELPYFTITPTFSICPTHGYLSGEKEECPDCGEKCEIWSRSVGYLRPVEQWHDGKKSEFEDRETFDQQLKVQSVSSDKEE